MAKRGNGIFKNFYITVKNLFWAIVIIFTLVNLLTLGRLLVNPSFPVFTDLPQYIVAGNMVKGGLGDRLYEAKESLSLRQEIVKPYSRFKPAFRNPPFVALFYIPFSGMHLRSAYFMSILANIFLIILLGFISVISIDNLGKNKLFFLILPGFYPVAHNAMRGQISVLLALAVLGVYFFWKKKKPFTSGIIYSFLLIKPQFFVVGLPFFLFLSDDKRKFLSGLGASFLLLLAASLVISGRGFPSSYLAHVYNTENAFFGSPVTEMFSMYSVAYFLVSLSNIGGTITAHLLHGAVYLFTFYVFITEPKKTPSVSSRDELDSDMSFSFKGNPNRKIGENVIKYEKGKENLLFAAAVIFTALFAYHVLPYDWAMVVVSLFIIVDQTFDEDYINKIILYSSAMIIIAGIIFLNAARYPIYISFVYLIGVIILALACRDENESFGKNLKIPLRFGLRSRRD